MKHIAWCERETTGPRWLYYRAVYVLKMTTNARCYRRAIALLAAALPALVLPSFGGTRI